MPIVLILALVLTGCASSDSNVYGSAFGQKVVGNETYVTVSNVWNEMDALPLAERHCKQFGKLARFNHAEGYRSIFDCVR